MKLLCSLILALCILFSFASCAWGVLPEPSEAPTTEALTEPPSTAPATDPPTAPPATEAPTEPPKRRKIDLETAVGNTDGNTYSNTVIGAICTLDEDWYVMSEEELVEYYAYSIESYKDYYKQILENQGSPIIFSAMTYDALDAISITLYRSSYFAHLTGGEPRIAEMMLSNQKRQSPDLGIEIDELETSTATLAGQEHACVVLSGWVGEQPLYMKTVVVYTDQYTYFVTVQSPFEDRCDELLQYFKSPF